MSLVGLLEKRSQDHSRVSWFHSKTHNSGCSHTHRYGYYSKRKQSKISKEKSHVGQRLEETKHEFLGVLTHTGRTSFSHCWSWRHGRSAALRRSAGDSVPGTVPGGWTQALCRVCTQIPDSRRESRWSAQATLLPKQFRPREPVSSIRKW